VELALAEDSEHWDAGEDDGPGIPADRRDTVFDRGCTTSDDGTGFGLAIVQDVVDARDSEIELTEAGARSEIIV